MTHHKQDEGPWRCAAGEPPCNLLNPSYVKNCESCGTERVRSQQAVTGLAAPDSVAATAPVKSSQKEQKP